MVKYRNPRTGTVYPSVWVGCLGDLVAGLFPSVEQGDFVEVLYDASR